MKTLEEIMQEEMDIVLYNQGAIGQTRKIAQSLLETCAKSWYKKASKRYAQQFIDSANDIINPATEIFPDTYNDELDKWFKIQKINEYDRNKV